MIGNLLFRAFRKVETNVHELNYLFWECTTRCNLHCRHCGSDCKEAAGERDMPIADFIGALETIPKDAIVPNFTVVLTGGEPLLRPDLAEAGRQIRQHGFHWGMVSNGYFYTAEKQLELLRAGMGALTISLDGLEQSHDWMRGRTGSFARALNAIKLAVSEPRLYFDVVTCVNQRNISELEDVYNLLSDAKVPQWRIFTIIPIGRALDDPELHLTDAQFVRLMEFIKSHRDKQGGMNVTFSCEGYLGPYERKVRQAPYFCHAGVNIASVLIDGRICACPNIDRDRFSQGSIYTDNLYQVWNERFEPFRNRNWARTGICKGCKAFKNCLGNGMHNWHGSGENVINCHYHKILNGSMD
ncbi:MAG: TIGR04133 family radical SAM/SPASM protein [Salinivirgaceae bacterium]|nr:TIGR04133 family radical SAM/SPASM protein [Salinivirgaceae bacterium]